METKNPDWNQKTMADAAAAEQELAENVDAKKGADSDIGADSEKMGPELRRAAHKALNDLLDEINAIVTTQGILEVQAQYDWNPSINEQAEKHCTYIGHIELMQNAVGVVHEEERGFKIHIEGDGPVINKEAN